MRYLTILIFIGFFVVSTAVHASVLRVQEVKSKSGVTAWLVEDPTVDVISIEYAFKNAGAKNDTPTLQGLTRILSNTMDEGAGEYDSKAFQGALNQYSISLSFSAGRDDFGGSFKTLTKYKDKAFELLSLAIRAPRFDDEAVQRMIDANKARINDDKTNPDWMQARIENDVLYAGHPYAQNSGGTLTSLSRITPAMLKEKHAKDLTKDRLVVAVVGRITPSELSNRLDQVFGDLPVAANSVDIKSVRLDQNPVRAVYIQNMPQTILSLSGQGVSYKDTNYFASMVMNQIFGAGGFGSRLMETVREKKGLTYGIYSNLSEMNAAQIFSISTSVQNKNVPALLKAVGDEMTRMKAREVSDKELSEAKSFLIGSVPLELTSTSKIASMMLSFQKWGLPTNYLDIREEGIRRVTKADVQRAAQSILNIDKMSFVAVGQPVAFHPTKIYTTLPNVN